MLWGHNIHISDHSQHNYYPAFVILISYKNTTIESNKLNCVKLNNSTVWNFTISLHSAFTAELLFYFKVWCSIKYNTCPLTWCRSWYGTYGNQILMKIYWSSITNRYAASYKDSMSRRAGANHIECQASQTLHSPCSSAGSKHYKVLAFLVLPDPYIMTTAP